jgi:hypothetical protein
MFKRYRIPKYTIYLNRESDNLYHGILYKELCKNCGYRLGEHNNYDCPIGDESFLDHEPEFYIEVLNKNIKIL